MRHRYKGRKLGVSAPHRRAMLANLASSLIEHGGINTTDARAKELRPYIEKLITLARRGDLHARRTVLSQIRNKTAVKKLFDEWAPQFATLPTADGEREWTGGYVRILKLGRRKGDSAPISMIEFVTPEGKQAAPKTESDQESASESVEDSAQDNSASEEASS